MDDRARVRGGDQSGALGRIGEVSPLDLYAGRQVCGGLAVGRSGQIGGYYVSACCREMFDSHRSHEAERSGHQHCIGHRRPLSVSSDILPRGFSTVPDSSTGAGFRQPIAAIWSVTSRT